jgi:hypothetical protein
MRWTGRIYLFTNILSEHSDGVEVVKAQKLRGSTILPSGAPPINISSDSLLVFP